MDADRFEKLLRGFSTTPSRRLALGFLASSALGGLFGLEQVKTTAQKGKGKGRGKGKGKNKPKKKGKNPQLPVDCLEPACTNGCDHNPQEVCACTKPPPGKGFCAARWTCGPAEDPCGDFCPGWREPRCEDQGFRCCPARHPGRGAYCCLMEQSCSPPGTTGGNGCYYP